MYTQLVQPDESSAGDAGPEASVFEDKIDRAVTIEPTDWMPEAYRKTLLRQISQHAHSEIVGMLPEANWLTRAPRSSAKLILLAKVQDEGGHGLYLYSAAETLGTSRDDMFDALLESARSIRASSTTRRSPGRCRCDRLARRRRRDHQSDSLTQCSYGPYARAMVRICKEESFHQRQGYDVMVTLARGTPEQHAMAQDALDRCGGRR